MRTYYSEVKYKQTPTVCNIMNNKWRKLHKLKSTVLTNESLEFFLFSPGSVVVSKWKKNIANCNTKKIPFKKKNSIQCDVSIPASIVRLLWIYFESNLQEMI